MQHFKVFMVSCDILFAFAFDDAVFVPVKNRNRRFWIETDASIKDVAAMDTAPDDF